MAMQNSSELSELVDTVFKELTKLDFALNWCIINIIDVSTLSNMVWAANPDIDKAPDSYLMKFEDYPFHDAMMKGYKERATKYIYVLEGLEKKVYDEYLFKETEFRKVPEEAQAASRAMEKYVCSFTFSNFGGLQTVGDKALSDSNLDILARFGKVFDLTYTRFNDLQKAEAQAREAQIEAALERVRSRTMGMQKSEELKEVIQLVYEQFVHLNIHIEHTGFIMDYKARDDMHIWLADRHEVPSEVTIPYFDCAHWNSFIEAKEKGIDFFANHLTFEEKNKFYQDLFKLIPGVPEKTLEYYFGCPGLAISTVLLENVGLYIENFSGIPYSDEENNTLMRFGKVFQQTYTRFNDLKQAEAQAREAQIETALERVRSRSMAMHKSDELVETSDVLFQELNKLEIVPIRTGIGIIDGSKNTIEVWSRSELNDRVENKILGVVPMNIHPLYEGIIKAWKDNKPFYSHNLAGDELIDYYDKLSSFLSYPKRKKYNQKETIATFFFPEGSLNVISHEPLKEEECEIVIRFAKVFGQVYQRFLDLQKAEAQAREAQIEAALERVRSRSMAMHKSEELSETAEVLFEQINLLGKIPDRMSIGIINEESKNVEFWLTDQGGNQLSHEFFFSLDEPTSIVKIYNAWKERKDSFVVDLTGQKLQDWLLFVKENAKLPIDETKIIGRRVQQAAFFSQGFLLLTTHNPVADEIMHLLVRFAKVFDQTYRRFLDLQKAESQAREAQIEAALEKVRSRTMAMQRSEELSETSFVLFQQFAELGVVPNRFFIGILNKEEGIFDLWITEWGGTMYSQTFKGNLEEPLMWKKVYEAWKAKDKAIVVDIMGEDLVRWNEYLKSIDFPVASRKFVSRVVNSCAIFSKGFISITTPEITSTETVKLLERFASVFDGTYTRFIDLKNAEAQAREAQIEASLERVRSKAMSMHSSEDLSATVNVFFKELKTLGIAPIRCGVGQIDEETRTTSLTTTTSSQQGDSFEVIGKIKQTGHPVLDGIYEHWELQKEYHPVLQGDDIKAYYSVMKPQMAFPDYPEDATQYGNLFYFKEGFVFAWTESKLIEDEMQIFRRFTSVLSLTYRRYMDLKEAEARAREAEQQASLDRVRAEIASMRTTDDLEKITPLIWRELTTLGVPFFRCGVFIIDEPNAVAHAYLSTPLGKSLAALHVKIDKTWLENAVNNWRKRKIYHEVWNREQFIAWTQTMMAQGFVENKEHFQAGKEAPETLSLQLLPFTQGMLYVGSKLPLSKEEIKIAEKLADDFGVAYSRYEDFQKLEDANHRKTAELEEARQLQLSMLPKELPKLPNLDIAVYMKTATEVGGDYYDFNVNPDGTLTVAIGDATGHGMKAGTIVSMIKALFASGGSRMDMKTFFNQSSDALKRIELGRLMMGFVMLKIKTNKLKFANAGMPPLFIYRKRLGKVEEIMIHAMPLGAIKDFPYEISELEISSGDTILLLSDGLPELKNERNQQYGYAQVKEKFKLAAKKSPDEIVEYLKNTASKWINGVEPDDDVTFVVIKVK
jgi:serine phosphatase RsbU (regulator of sigma subunit)